MQLTSRSISQHRIKIFKYANAEILDKIALSSFTSFAILKENKWKIPEKIILFSILDLHM